MRQPKSLNVREVIKMMLLRRNVSLSTLARSLNETYGYTFSQSNLSRKLINNTVKWNEFQDMAEILGYKIRLDENTAWSGIKEQ